MSDSKSKEYHKKYYHENRDKILEVANKRLNKIVTCDVCNKQMKQSSYYRHRRKSESHKKKAQEKENELGNIEKKVLNVLRRLIDY
jgi:hypothetical protein